MENHLGWLLAEIELWKSEGLVSPEQAAQLRARYAKPAVPAVPWGLLVFATAGAIVIGLGVILLFAYNWDDIPKYGKLTLVFGSIALAHFFGLRLVRRDDWQARLGEALIALGTMLYGAGIWLVAQIYNIDEHYPNGFLWWGIGALAMAWVIRSTANALIAVVLLSIWGCCEVFDFREPEFAAIVWVAAGVLPFAWRQGSGLLLAAALAAIQLLLAASLANWGSGGHAFAATLAWAVLLIAIARLGAGTRIAFQGSAAVLTFFGFGAFLVCAYLLSFKQLAAELLDWTRRSGAHGEVAGAAAWSLFGLAVIAWLRVAQRSLVAHTLDVRREEWVLPIALLYSFLISALGAPFWNEFVALSFNLMLLGIAVMWMWRGCQESLLPPTVLGSLILSAIVLARYFDLFHSLASRGAAFIALGIIFVAEAMYYRRIRQSNGGSQ